MDTKNRTWVPLSEKYANKERTWRLAERDIARRERRRLMTRWVITPTYATRPSYVMMRMDGSWDIDLRWSL